MKKELIGTCVCGDEFLYDLYSFNGHVSRVYSDGRIGQADDSDRRYASTAERLLKIHFR